MYPISTKNLSKAILFAFIFLLFSQSFISAQSTFRISKPIIGTNQICSSTTNYYNNLSYAFSSNVVNSSGTVPYHFVELSNENGLIQPREIGCFSPYVNVIYVGNIDINGQNLPAGGGYKIRVFSKSPSVYSDYAETFTILSSPARPTLNVSGSVDLCTGATQTLTVTNPASNVSYQWQNSSSNIANATSNTYIANNTGNYSVKTVGSNGCSISSNAVYVSRINPLSSYMSVNSSNGYYGGALLFSTPSQGITVRATFNGGKSPYGFTMSDGSTTTTETNISYSKEYTLTAPVTGYRTYTLATVTDACGTQLTNAASARVRINESNYCSTSGLGVNAINSFSIQGTTINNANSGKSADGWGEFLTPANINANVNYNFTLASNNSNQKYFAIWADLNQNNSFESTERIFPANLISSYGQTMNNSFTGVLKLPSTTYNGQVRLRIQLSDDSYSANYNCYSLSNGEVEDYVLRVFNGVVPTTISTDSLPVLGVCKNSNFNLGFKLTGTAPPANTIYRVEASSSLDFSNAYILGTGQNSPIVCNTGSIYWTNSNYFVRVTTTSTAAIFVKKNAPNLLYIKDAPTATLNPFLYNNNWYSYYSGGLSNDRNLSVANGTTPIAIRADIGSSQYDYPVRVTLNDGRIFTVQNGSPWQSNFIKVDSNLTANATLKYKIVQVSNRICTNNRPDSVLIRGGNPYLNIMKVYKGNYNDTTSISKLCGYFQVKFAGDFLDTLGYKFYHVQISDANGSFANARDIGHVCIYKVLNESQGGQDISCSIPANLPPGSGYRLRIVKKTGNVTSPVYSTIFEVLDPNTTSFAANLTRSVINEGEVTALNVNFVAGIPPYSLYVNNGFTSQNYATTGNSNSLIINLGPIHGSRYELYSYGGSVCGNYNRVYKHIDVRTLDKDNAQWYIKTITYQNSYYEYLKKMSITNSSDTLFKKTFSNSYTNGLINGYYDYNSNNLLMAKTTVQVGESYNFSQSDNSVNTYYNNNLTGVWIDANQDGDFEDAGEELTKNQFGTPWNLTQNQTFTIPNNANIGFSRIRIRTVSKGNNAEPFDLYASNPLEKNGVTYDIPVVILSSSVSSIISTPKISGNTLCNGNSFNIDFSKYGIPAGTSASVELSDISGNFPATPTVIGQGTISSINVTLPLPLTIPSGNYNIRVVSNGVTSPISPSFNVSSNQLTSMVDGDWHAGSTWSCGRIPTYVDATTVAGGTTVTVFSGDASVGSILTNGVLSFLNGTTLRFRQP